MSRVVIYPSASSAPQKPGTIHFGGPGASAREPEGAGTIPDGYAEKLMKFVPAEVVAFFAPMAALVQDRPLLMVAAAVVGLAATPAYLVAAARNLPSEQRPPLHYYILSSIAFVAWALGTSDLGALAGLDSIATAFTLGVTVLLIPLADSVLTRSPASVGSTGK